MLDRQCYTQNWCDVRKNNNDDDTIAELSIIYTKNDNRSKHNTTKV